MTDAARLRKQRRFVLLLALAVRLLSLYSDSRLPMFRELWLDSALYDEAGRIIASGDWTLGHDVLHMSPAYSYFVGLIYSLIGITPAGVRLIQVALGLVTVSCIHRVAERLYGERWALLAGLVAALYGPFVFYDTQLLADGLATVLSAAFLLFLVRTRDAGTSWRPWIWLGVIWGLAIITRPNTLVLAAPLLLAVGLTEGARWKSLATVIVSAAVVVLPVTARNVLVAHEWVPVTDTGGMNFYIGNGPDSVGTFHAPPGMPEADKPQAQFVAYRKIAEKASGRTLSAREVDTYWRARTWHYIRQHPRTWLRLMLEKLWLFWNAREISNTEDYTFQRALNPVLGLPLVQFGWMAPFALIGTVLLLVRRRKGEWLVGATNVALCAANVAVFILARYRISALPGLIIAAVGCVAWLSEAARQRQWRTLTPAGVAFAILLVVVWWPKLPASPDRQYLKLGNSYYHAGDLASAAQAYQTAVSHNADNISAQKNLAVVLDLRGDRAGSQQHWREVARLASATGRTEYATEAAKHLAQ